MPTAKLTRRTVAQLPVVSKPTTFYDQEVPGFGLRVFPPSSRHPQGFRSWIVEYRPGGGGRRVTSRRLTLGSAAVMAPEQARNAAKDVLARVRQGEDPAAERNETRAALSIAELEPTYTGKFSQRRSDGTKELYARYWRRHILPAIGNLRPRDLTHHRIEKLYDDIAATRPVTANRVHTTLRHFLKWCRQNGYAPAGVDPTDGIDRRKEDPRERYLSADEWQRLDAAITLAERDGVPWTTRSNSKHLAKPANRKTRIDAGAADAIRLLAFTGARLREILHLQWSEYDRDGRMLRLEKTKSGRSKRVLGAPAIELLERLWERETAADGVIRKESLEVPASLYVFPAPEDPAKPRADLKRPWAAVTRAAGLEGLRVHDLRHNFASVGIGQGLSLPVIGGLLGHKSTAATARYAHLMDDAARRAADLLTSVLR